GEAGRRDGPGGEAGPARRTQHVALLGGPVAQDDVRARRTGEVLAEVPAGEGLLVGDGQRPDLRDLRVEVPARTGGLADVPVAVDGGEVPLGDPLLHRAGAHAVQAELPGEQPAVGVDHGRGGLRGLVVAARRHRAGVVAVAARVGPDPGTADAAVPALPDAAEAVDQEVVADVGPAA